jgi:hypothetical protein
MFGVVDRVNAERVREGGRGAGFVPKRGKNRGGILGGNPNGSLKSFPPCYSQTPLQTNCTSLLQFLGLEISTALPCDFYSNS